MLSEDDEINRILGMTTVAQAADFLDVTPCRVLQFIRDKRLKAQKVTPQFYLVDSADLRRFKKLTRKPGRPAKK